MTGNVIKYDFGGVLKTDLAQLPEQMLDYAEEVLLDQAHMMKGLAQILVRVDTGSLRDSIRVERGGRKLHWRTVRVRAGGYVTNPDTGRKVDYAAVVERKYPFMQPAWDSVKGTVVLMIEQRVVNGVEK